MMYRQRIVPPKNPFAEFGIDGELIAQEWTLCLIDSKRELTDFARLSIAFSKAVANVLRGGRPSGLFLLTICKSISSDPHLALEKIRYWRLKLLDDLESELRVLLFEVVQKQRARYLDKSIYPSFSFYNRILLDLRVSVQTHIRWVAWRIQKEGDLEKIVTIETQTSSYQETSFFDHDIMDEAIDLIGMDQTVQSVINPTSKSHLCVPQITHIMEQQCQLVRKKFSEEIPGLRTKPNLSLDSKRPIDVRPSCTGYLEQRPSLVRLI